MENVITLHRHPMWSPAHRPCPPPVFATSRHDMTHQDHNHDHTQINRAGRFSLSQGGVGARLLLAAGLVVLIWATIIALVM